MSVEAPAFVYLPNEEVKIDPGDALQMLRRQTRLLRRHYSNLNANGVRLMSCAIFASYLDCREAELERQASVILDEHRELFRPKENSDGDYFDSVIADLQAHPDVDAREFEQAKLKQMEMLAKKINRHHLSDLGRPRRTRLIHSAIRSMYKDSKQSETTTHSES